MATVARQGMTVEKQRVPPLDIAGGGQQAIAIDRAAQPLDSIAGGHERLEEIADLRGGLGIALGGNLVADGRQRGTDLHRVPQQEGAPR